MKVLLRTLIFTVLVPGAVTVYIPYRILERRAEFSFAGYALLGILPIALGAAIYLWCAWDFAFAGQGTPAPIDAPRRLVVRGLYRFVRNPMYAGILLILLGESVLFGSRLLLGYALCLCLFFYLFVRLYEEPTLRRKFGPEYDAYCRGVPRWFPRLRG